MASGLKKRYMVLLIALVIILITSLIALLTKIGLYTYEGFAKNDKSESSESSESSKVAVAPKDVEDIVINKELDSDEFKSNLYAFLGDNQLYGFKNSYGEVIISPKYEIAGDYSEGLASVYIDGKYGYIDRDENLIIKCDYKRAYEFKNGLAIVQRSDYKQAVINKNGEELFTVEDYELSNIVGDYILVTEKNSDDYRAGYLNQKGEKVGEVKYSTINEFKDGYAVVGIAGKYGIINEEGTEVVPLIYSNISGFSEGYAILDGEDGTKLINKELKEVKLDNIIFDSSYEGFINGFIVGNDSNTYDSIILNKDLKEMFREPEGYYFSGIIKSNILVFYDDQDRVIFVDSNGDIKFECEEVKIISYGSDNTDNYFIMKKTNSNEKIGVVDVQGKEIVPFKYSNIESKDGFIICTKEGIFNDKVDIYYDNKKITNESIKADSVNIKGDGVLRIWNDNNEGYYLNKYGQRF